MSSNRKNRRKRAITASGSWKGDVATVVWASYLGGRPNPRPELPLLTAASVELMQRMVAQNPTVDPFSLFQQTHVMVDPFIWVPIFMAEENRTEVIIEVFTELVLRYPEEEPRSLFDSIFETLDAAHLTADAP